MTEPNPHARIEAFSDGVFAIAMTLLVIDIRIPGLEKISSTHELWMALLHLLPSVATFILSFTIILITWVNHHSGSKLVSGSSSSHAFIYANGFLLLTVVILPFPTSLLGETILTDHAGPAVALYNAVVAAQGLAWVLLLHTVIAGKQAKSEKAEQIVRRNLTYGYYAFTLYSFAAVIALWFPVTIAIVTTLIWGFWLIIGINTKED